MQKLRMTLILLLWAVFFCIAHAEDIEPEGATGTHTREKVYAKDYMVVSPHPQASKIGETIIQQGGNAMDAAVAMQVALTLFEPQSSGIGGGAFLMYYDANTKEVYSFDGREMAPASADGKLFLKPSGEPLSFCEAVVGGQSVGVPGIIKLLELSHHRYGQMPWALLFKPTIEQAEKGFIVSPRLAQLIGYSCATHLGDFPESRDYFFPRGNQLQAGERITNPKLANILKRIAKQGSNGFYRGKVAKSLVAMVRRHGGLLQYHDMIDYHAQERPPICFSYQHYKICSMGPPSSGATTLYALLMTAQHFNFGQLNYKNPEVWHYYSEGAKLAYADRDTYIADVDWVPVPVYGLLNKEYVTKRLSVVRRDQTLPIPVQAGIPPESEANPRMQAPAIELSSTSHIAVVDKQGNAVSLTGSVEHAFGSNLMVHGFLLNNQLTDFSFVPHHKGALIANRVQAHKRPRSSMTPTIILDEQGNLVAVLGSAGGSRIIHYVAQTVISMLDWGLDIQDAIELPNLTNNNGITFVEAGTWMENLVSPLEKMGHRVEVQSLTSGTHGIQVLPDGILLGGVDPRREGLAVGR